MIEHAANVASSNSGGCPWLFLTSALTSLGIGSLNRSNQEKETRKNIDSKTHLDRLRQEYENEKFDAELIHRRLLLEEGRASQLIEAQSHFECRKKMIEDSYFLENCWPLKEDVFTGFSQLRELLTADPVPLTVILSKPNSTRPGSKTANLHKDYRNLTNALKREAANASLQNLDIKIDPWRPAANNTGGNAHSMNIHYILQGNPSLLITPQVISDTLYFDVAIWSFGRGLGSLLNSSIFRMPYNDDDYPTLEDKIKTVLLAITGAVRDAYAMIEYQRPAQLPTQAARFEKYPEIMDGIIRPQYRSLSRQMTVSNDFRQLASPGEFTALQRSIAAFQ